MQKNINLLYTLTRGFKLSIHPNRHENYLLDRE